MTGPRGMILELFGGPGGLSEGARMAGLEDVARLVAIELDAAACATRAAAGHRTIRADVAAFPAGQMAAARVLAVTGSPPCTTFSAAGDGAGNAITDLLADLICDLFEGRDTRAEHREAMDRALTASDWPRQELSPAARAAKIRDAVLSAALVAEPARFIAAARPQWIALEQVPAVLPLWRVYAAELRKLGYSAWCGILNAADYGVPQTRQRAILIASRTRTVRRPEPTHYDPRKGMQLWGTPWVGMAEALGWGATGRPVPTVTAGGTRTGGAEPFGHRDRDALEAERDAGAWALRRNRGAGLIERGGPRRDHPLDEPAPTITSDSKGGNRLSWVNPNSSGHAKGYERGTERPSPTITSQVNLWTVRTGNNGEMGDGTLKPYERSADEPAPTVDTGAGGKWVLRNNTQANSAARPLDQPGGTMFFGHRGNDVSWVRERPATTVQGDPRIGRPGHKDRDQGESQFAQDSVRITVEEAAALQSFPPGYPFQGGKTARFTQIGNAVPPLLAAHIFAEAAGLASSEAVA